MMTLTVGSILGMSMAVAFCVVCLFMMLVILIQKPRGGGLSGAFGGAGGGSATDMFGAKTGDVLTWFTVVCFALFLLLAVGLTWTMRPEQASRARSTVPGVVDETQGPVAGEPATPAAGLDTQLLQTTGESPPSATDESPLPGGASTQPVAP